LSAEATNPPLVGPHGGAQCLHVGDVADSILRVRWQRRDHGDRKQEGGRTLHHFLVLGVGCGKRWGPVVEPAF
jgi:hypothetical protein